jgi:hypothetical protein
MPEGCKRFSDGGTAALALGLSKLTNAWVLYATHSCPPTRTTDADGPLDDLVAHSVTYRVAVGPRAGQKVFSLQTSPGRADESRKGVAQYAGFSLHAGIGVEADQREKLERLTRYVSRPPVSVERLDLTAQGQVRYRLKTP